MEIHPTMDQLYNNNRNRSGTGMRCSRSVAIPSCHWDVGREDEEILQAEQMYAESTWRMYYRIVAARKLAASTRAFNSKTDLRGKFYNNRSAGDQRNELKESTLKSNQSNTRKWTGTMKRNGKAGNFRTKTSSTFDQNRNSSDESTFFTSDKENRNKEIIDFDYGAERALIEDETHPIMFPLDMEE